MKKMYIIRYCGGGYDDWYEANVFVTDKKRDATKYVTKFNRLLKKWKEHYKQYEHEIKGLGSWLKDEHLERHFDRWDTLRNINKCYWNEIDFR
jgi:hypothetical protein